MGKILIAYPLKKGGSRSNDIELQMSLRSVEKHWKGGYDLVGVYGEDVPQWVNREAVRVVDAKAYMLAWEKAVEDAGDGGRILWMNDDIVFLKDTSWEHLTHPVRTNSLKQISLEEANSWVKSSNGWIRRMGEVALTLNREGKPTWNFSTHTPYAFEVDKLRVILKKYGHLGYKLPVECAYFNEYLSELGGTVRILDKYRTTKSVLPPNDMRQYRFANLCDSAIGVEMKGYLAGRFPYFSKFEVTPDEVDPLIKGSFRGDALADEQAACERVNPTVESEVEPGAVVTEESFELGSEDPVGVVPAHSSFAKGTSPISIARERMRALRKLSSSIPRKATVITESEHIESLETGD